MKCLRLKTHGSVFPVISLVMLVAIASSRGDVSDFRVNDDGGAVEQTHPRVAVTADGTFAVVWSDYRFGQGDILLQRLTSTGQAIGPNVRINDDTLAAHQSDPVLAVDVSGRLTAAWLDYRNGSFPFDPDIFIQRFDSTVIPLDGNREITVEWPDSLKESPDLALSPWGGGVVVWADYRNRNWDVYGQLISATGTLMGGNFKINDDAGVAQQHAPRVSVSPDGWFVVTWYDDRLGDDDIFVQVFDSLARPQGDNARVNTDPGGTRQAFPDVAADGAGRFTVVWVDWRNGQYPSNPDIYARQYASDLTPLTAERQVSADASGAPQRQPCIAADRRGNVAILWSDSMTGSWEISGQMIDAEGVIREGRFTANVDPDSAQVQPDVALDGRNRYIVWTDKRNGDFDIYCSIAAYNQPQLVPQPPSLQFVMEAGGTPPPPQTLAIKHAGYNPLNWSAAVSASWLTVAPVAGVTPGSATVSVNTDTLALGTYLATITLIDLTDNDSTQVVPVRLDVTAPILSLDTDTVRFRAFLGVDTIRQTAVRIENAGAGSFTWTATDSSVWLEEIPSTGVSDDNLLLVAHPALLSAGVYRTMVHIDAPEALGAPDSIAVLLEVVNDLPYLQVRPESVYIRTAVPAEEVISFAVTNAGAGILDWRARADQPWLIPDKTAGMGDDRIEVTFDAALLTGGRYSGELNFIDSGAFNIEQRVPLTLDVYTPSEDTLFFGSAMLPRSGSGALSLRLVTRHPMSELIIPFETDASLLAIDSLGRAAGLPAWVQATLEQLDSSRSYMHLTCGADSSLTPGVYALGDLFITAGSIDTALQLAPAFFDTLHVQLVAPDSGEYDPVIIPGEVQIGVPTAVGTDPDVPLPDDIELHQNYPNPFNATTVISFSLPRRAEVELELFNVLGQQVTLLASGVKSAGVYSVVWNGRFDNGRTAPSGIYFYRLRSGTTSRVGKMVLLK